MKINTISITGKTDEFEIAEKIFSSGINSKLIAPMETEPIKESLDANPACSKISGA